MNNSFKQRWTAFIGQQQESICTALENCDGKERFKSEQWLRDEGKGGGGLTNIIRNGAVFEKGGVNTSAVFGKVTELMQEQLAMKGDSWFACGISIVIHPYNPMVPTIHCNYRLFEVYNEKDELTDRWFGGGTDLTPYYLFREDAVHFHQTYKEVCDDYDSGFYSKFKRECDDYFVNSHRNDERRGIGGIFYDQQRVSQLQDEEFWMNFSRACANAFIPSYLPIVEKRKRLPFTDEQKHWQEIRRGRYTEFNLIHDRGTVFGLKTNGRVESILMSLPPVARFEYDYSPPPGSEEDKLLQVCLQPVDWIEAG